MRDAAVRGGAARRMCASSGDQRRAVGTGGGEVTGSMLGVRAERRAGHLVAADRRLLLAQARASHDSMRMRMRRVTM